MRRFDGLDVVSLANPDAQALGELSALIESVALASSRDQWVDICCSFSINACHFLGSLICYRSHDIGGKGCYMSDFKTPKEGPKTFALHAISGWNLMEICGISCFFRNYRLSRLRGIFATLRGSFVPAGYGVLAPILWPN